MWVSKYLLNLGSEASLIALLSLRINGPLIFSMTPLEDPFSAYFYSSSCTSLITFCLCISISIWLCGSQSIILFSFVSWSPAFVKCFFNSFSFDVGFDDSVIVRELPTFSFFFSCFYLIFFISDSSTSISFIFFWE